MKEAHLDRAVQAKLLYEWRSGRVVPVKRAIMKHLANRVDEGSYHLQAIARHLKTGRRRTVIDMAISPSFTLDMKPLEPVVTGGPLKLDPIQIPCPVCRGLACSADAGDDLGFTRLHKEITASLRPLLRAIRERIVQNFLVDEPSKAHGWRKPCPACEGWGTAKPAS